MATPRNVSRSLKKTATQLAKIPDESVRAIATDVVEFAADTGGGFGRRRYPLTASVRVRGGKKNRIAEVYGQPAGFWSVKTYGRSGFTVRRTQRGSRRLKGFRIGDGYATSTGPTGPARSGRWGDVVDYAAETAPEILVRDVRAAVDG